jgi:uncharacterized membrane protein (TIGR02234 family)
VSAASQSRTEADLCAPPARPGAGSRRSLAAALLLGVTGATVVLVAAGETWLHGTTSLAQGSLQVSGAGRQATGAPGALALVGLAALVAIFAVRGVSRVIVSALLALCGAGALAAALLARGDTAALRESAAIATGLANAPVGNIGTTAWPLVSAVGAVLVLAAGIIALARGRSWPAMSSRYDRAGAPSTPRRAVRQPAFDPDRPEDLWKALDRGEDPTDTA